jgi:hypothetical protein
VLSNKLAKTLLNQIIEMAEVQDVKWKEVNHLIHQSSQTIGDSSILFHLNVFKELLNQPPEAVTQSIPAGAKYDYSWVS